MTKKRKIEEEEERERPTQLVSATNSEAEAEAVMTSYYLSEDIMVNILSRLPVKSIKRFMCVSKLWYILFRNPNFITMHHNQGIENENFKLMINEKNHIYSSIDDDNCCNPSSLTCLDQMSEINYPFTQDEEYSHSTRIVHIWGSCNGLICMTASFISDSFNSEEDMICIWNPSTKEYKKLPSTSILDPESPYTPYVPAFPLNVVYGLGYDSNIGDYKLVIVSTFSHTHDTLDCQVKVYTLRSNSWKQIPDIYSYGMLYDGVLVNGTLHWAANDCPHISEGSCFIVSFDFGTERFTQVPMPEHLDVDKFRFFDVSAFLGGSLCIHCTKYDEDCLQIWVMKDYGVRESWTKIFNIAQPSRGSYKLIQPFKNDEFLLCIASNNANDRKDSLVVYNSKNERVRTLKIQFGYRSDVMTYVESLVSLDTGTFVVQERVAELKEYDEKEEKQENDDVGLQLF